MAGNGLNLGVGIDLSQFDKDISYVNKKLNTVGGQVELATIKFKDSDNPLVKQIQEAQKMYEKAFDGMSKVLYEKIGKNGKLEIFDINNVKEAEEAVAYLKKQLAKVETSNNPNKDKLVSSYTQQIADVNQYIIAVGKLSDAFAKAGLASMPKGDRARLAERNAISEEIKLLQQKQALNKQNTQISDYTKLNEEIRLQKELISLLEKKQSTYKNGYNKNASTQINAARNELEALRRQAKQISENNRLRNSEVSIIDKINNLEKKRTETNGLNSKIERYQQERIIVGRLVTQWERYLAIATKLNNTTGVANANAKLDALRKEEIALRNLEKAERDRVRAVNQNKSLLNEQEGLFNKLKTAASNYLSIYQLFRVGKDLIEATKYFEQQRVALEGIVGSAAEATKAINQLKQMSLESPKTLKELVGYTKQLSAYGIAVEELLPTTKKLADLSSGLGVDMSRLILAYGQVNAASVLRGQELRQFTEAGIPLVEKLADKFTALNGKLVTTGEVFELISKRQVSFQMVSDVLSDMTAEGGEFYKMQEKLTDTLYGQIEKLKDVWTIQLNEVGSKLNGFIRGAVETLQEVIKNLPLILHAITTGISMKALTSLPLIFGKIGKELWKARVHLRYFSIQLHRAAGAGAKLGVAIKGIGYALKSNLVVAAISLIVGEITNAIAKSREWKRELEEINTSFAKDTAKLTVGFDNLINKISTAGENTKAYADAVSTLKANYGDFVNDSMIEALIEESRVAKKAGDEYLNLAGSIKAAIEARKEWERHETIKSTASEGLVSELDINDILGGGLIKLIANYAKQEASNEEAYNTKGYLEANAQKTLYKRILSDIKSNNAENAFANALSSFFENGETTVEELSVRMVNEFNKYFGVNSDISKYISDNISSIYKEITDNKKWDTYLKEVEILANTPEKLIRDAFANVKKVVEGDEYKSLIGDGEDYNPIGTDLESQKLYIKTFDEQLKKAIGEDNALFKTQAYTKAMEMDEGDYGKGKALLSAVKEYASTLEKTDQAVYTAITNISNVFKEFAGEIGDVADVIRSNGAKWIGFETLKPTEREKDYLKQFLIVNDSNVDEQQKVLYKEIEDLKKYINENDPDNNVGKENYRKKVDDKKRTLQLLQVLTTGYYYGPDLSTSSKDNVDVSTANFINELKTAYQRYKDAIQKGGIGMGLNYVRNDEEFTKMFGKFFHGANSEMFKKLSEVMIGDTNAGELLKDKFLTGMEEGVLDFESAITAIAKELEEYAMGDEKNRKQYEQAAKQLRQWINTTFSKDDLSIALKDLEKQVKSLSNTFAKEKSKIELVRDLQKNGTLNMFAKSFASEKALGIQAEPARSIAIAKELQALKMQALTPDSKILEALLRNTVANINGKLPSGAASFSFEGKNLSNIDDLYAAIDEIGKITEMNNNNIAGTQFGPFGKEIIKILEEMIKVRSEEMKSISGEIFSGDELYDSLMNAIKMIDKEINANIKQQNTAGIDNLTDSGAYKKSAETVQARAKEFIDLYMKDNRLDVLADESKWMLRKDGIDKLRGNINEGYVNVRGKKVDIPEILKKELLYKLDDLEINIDNYNANMGAFGSFSRAITNYRNAGQTAYDKWKSESDNYNAISGQLETGKDLDGNTLSPEQIVKLNTELSLSKDRLTEMGHEGKNLKQELENISLDQANKSMSALQNKLSTLVNSVETIVSAMKDFATAFHKAYDVMNDGENPEWMQEVEDSLGDFGEMFSGLITPIMSVISLVSTLTITFIVCEKAMIPMLIAMAAIIAVAAIVSGIVAAAQAHDRALQRSIEDLEKQIEDTQTAMKNLDASAERMVGINKFKKQFESLSLNMKMYHDALEQARLEEEKKDTDYDKVKDFKQNSQEFLDAFKNGIRGMFDEITGSVDEFADDISSAMRSAFQNGENAARNMAAVVKESIGNIVEEIMKMNYLKPAIETAMNTLRGGSEDWFADKFTDDEGNFDYQRALDYFIKRLNNEDVVEDFEDTMGAISTGYIDLLNSLPNTLKDYFSFSSDNSALSGGISGITEDTARTLEGLGNSQLMQLILINRTLTQYLEVATTSSNSNQYMANVQTHLQQINSNVWLILSSITELRNTPSRPLHVTIV